MGSRLVAIASPDSASSPHARAIDELFHGSFIICGVIFAIVAGLVGYCIYRFREREGAVASQIEGHTRLEIAWTIVPFLIVLGLFGLTVRAVNASDPAVAKGEPDIVIVGHQWWWEVRYASGAVTANEIHIPTGRPLSVQIQSADVVHDFWVPDLARKIDAIPGYPVTIQMQADSPGKYIGACAEYCGAQHAWMRILVVAEPPEAFAAWEQKELLPAKSPVDERAIRGERLFNERTCSKCHEIAGETTEGPRETAAPDLTHLMGRSTLGAGVMENTPRDLAKWLLDPQEIKEGSHMPDLRLTDEETADLVAYFAGLP